MVSIDDVRAAREAISGRLHRTPVSSSESLAERTGSGAPIFLKAELFQKTGSIKTRGVLTILAALEPEQRERGATDSRRGRGSHRNPAALRARSRSR